MNSLRDYGPLNLLTALLLAEAEGEPLAGKVGVAWIVKNRVLDKRWPSSYEDVILQPKQFSCLNDGNSRRPVFMGALLPSQGGNLTKPIWRECRYVAHGAIHNWIRDPTKGSNHYHAFGCDPTWDDKMLRMATIGKHLFYKG